MVSPYYASKHAVVALSESLHFDLQLANAKVRASVLCPAFVQRGSPIVGETGHSRRARRSFRKECAAVWRLGRAGSDRRSVFEAVARDNQFWILTRSDFDELIRGRFEGMLERRDPEPHVFGAPG